MPSVFFRTVNHPCCARKRVMRSGCFPSQLLHLIDLYQHLNACWLCVKWCGARRCGAYKGNISCHEIIRTIRFEKEFSIWGSGEMQAANKLERLHIQHVGGGHAGIHHTGILALAQPVISKRSRCRGLESSASSGPALCSGSCFVTR